MWGQCHTVTLILSSTNTAGHNTNHEGQSVWGQCHTVTLILSSTKTNCWLNTPNVELLPEGRDRHSAFSYNGELYIFGGYKSSQTLNDVWKFSPETFSWKEVEPKGKGPGPMYGMCCCIVGDRIILFGGYYTPADDLFMLDMSPSLKTLCKLAVLQYDVEQFELPHNIRWELATMTATRTTKT